MTLLSFSMKTRCSVSGMSAGGSSSSGGALAAATYRECWGPKQVQTKISATAPVLYTDNGVLECWNGVHKTHPNNTGLVLAGSHCELCSDVYWRDFRCRCGVGREVRDGS